MGKLKQDLITEKKLLYKLVKEGDFTELDEFAQFVAEALHSYADEANIPLRAYQTKESVVRVSMGKRKYRLIIKEIKDAVNTDLPDALPDELNDIDTDDINVEKNDDSDKTNKLLDLIGRNIK